MEIYVHTDHNIDGHAATVAHVERNVAAALLRLGDHVTRIDVHFSDESARRSTGQNVRCMIEARPARQSAVIVTDHAETLDQALNGALHKLTRLFRRDDGRLADQNGRASIRTGAHRSVATATDSATKRRPPIAGPANLPLPRRR